MRSGASLAAGRGAKGYKYVSQAHLSPDIEALYWLSDSNKGENGTPIGARPGANIHVHRGDSMGVHLGTNMSVYRVG